MGYLRSREWASITSALEARGQMHGGVRCTAMQRSHHRQIRRRGRCDVLLPDKRRYRTLVETGSVVLEVSRHYSRAERGQLDKPLSQRGVMEGLCNFRESGRVAFWPHRGVAAMIYGAGEGLRF